MSPWSPPPEPEEAPPPPPVADVPVPRAVKIAVVVAAVVMGLVLLTSIDVIGRDDPPPATRTYTGFDTVPTSRPPTTSAR